MPANKKRSRRKTSKSSGKKDILAWWRKARFGMFIHWGLYSIPAGTWKGKKIPRLGEWIMYFARIPLEQYSKLAEKFNPAKYEPEKWVRLAKEAGMKYLVITAKHHDGFAMFKSFHPYNVVDATPWGKDPLKPLVAACRKHGLRVGFYYSQTQDWQDPNGENNSWDYDESKKDFAKYLREKVKPQLRELLSNYGRVDLIWFDTPRIITRRQSMDLKRYVRRLQPDCIVSGRIGNEVGDYGSMGDNQIPAGRVEGDWETPATMNETWGFKSYDRNWKSAGTLLQLLGDLAGKGVNYLLNVGPTADGEIPSPCVARLEKIGQWMRTNGEAIYGAGANPYPYQFSWGAITHRPGRLFLLVYKWRRKLVFYGLRNRVKGAYLLADKRKKVRVAQQHDKSLDCHEVELSLPARKLDRHVSVVVLEIAGRVDVDQEPMQQPGDSIPLPTHMAEAHVPKRGSRMRIHPAGFTVDWTTRSNWLSWDFKVFRPGLFEAKVVTTVRGRQKWKGGSKVRVAAGGRSVSGTLTPDEKIAKIAHQTEYVSKIGRLEMPTAGTRRLTLKLDKLARGKGQKMQVSAVRLEKCQEHPKAR